MGIPVRHPLLGGGAALERKKYIPYTGHRRVNLVVMVVDENGLDQRIWHL